jgi:hypothetical protein
LISCCDVWNCNVIKFYDLVSEIFRWSISNLWIIENWLQCVKQTPAPTLSSENHLIHRRDGCYATLLNIISDVCTKQHRHKKQERNVEPRVFTFIHIFINSFYELFFSTLFVSLFAQELFFLTSFLATLFSDSFFSTLEQNKAYISPSILGTFVFFYVLSPEHV